MTVEALHAEATESRQGAALPSMVVLVWAFAILITWRINAHSGSSKEACQGKCKDWTLIVQLF
jgi:hypothetical protein